MKKFITVVPLQVSGQLERYHYEAVGNSRLVMEEAVSFPILTAVNGYVEPNEPSKVIAVVTDTESGQANLSVLSEELKALSQRKGIICPTLETLAIPLSEAVSAHAETFRKLIRYLDDDDELFGCLTFGTKPLSEAVRMAIQYAYRVKKNASISCIVYGEIVRTGADRSQWFGRVHDETALLRLDEIVRLLADQGVDHPDDVLDGLLAL